MESPGTSPVDNNVNAVNTHVFVAVPIENTGFRSKAKHYGKKCLAGVKESTLLIALLISVVIGVIIGIIIRSTKENFTKREIMYIGFPGEILMRMLKMLILPIVLSSLISGIAGLDAKTCGKMGLRTICYFGTTTFFSVVLGILLCVSIRPGGNADRSSMSRHGETQELNSVDAYMDLIRNVFPDNLISACFNAYRTKDFDEEVRVKREPDSNLTVTTISPISITTTSQISYTGTPSYNATNETEYDTKIIQVPKNAGTNNPNVLGIVMFSILFGCMLGRMGERGRPIVAFCDALVEVTMRLFTMFLWFSPVGIAFLIAAKIVGMDDFSILLGKVGMYFTTVILGLFIHGGIVLPFLYFILVRKNPYRFIYGISQAMATAFGTASSSATMPVTLRCLEHNNHVDPRVASFVIPIGATINMDGTALYEAVAALFIAQVNDMTLDFGQIITTSITATAASVGAAGIPQAGLVTLVIVLSALGLPIEDVTLILVVDWFLDRFRTMTNVTGDCLGAGIVHHYSVHEMPPLEHEMHDTDPEKVPNGQQDITPV